MPYGRIIRAVMSTGALALATAAPGVAEAEPPGVTDVRANGNIFTGGLGFVPETVAVPVGGIVRWTNTDFLVPHTVTEAHGLWDLAGTYGGTPVSPPGFGPGRSVQRVFEAGTTAYYCRVHPRQMRGVVAVPVTLATVKRRVRIHGRRLVVRYVVATWTAAPPPERQVFDVEVRRGEAAWRPFRTGTVDTNGRLRAGRRGTVTHVRARLRRAAEPAAATGWSPDASTSSR
jgi:plastocyanin